MLDDIIVWWVDDEVLRRDAERLEHRRGWWRAIGGEDVTADPGDHRRAGPGGPRARWPRSRPRRPPIGRFRVGTAAVAGADCTVAGTGYTGEDGVELAVPADAAAGVWEAVLGTGVDPRRARRPRHAAPRGRACRCTATSSGPGITPLQAGLGWVVAWDKGRLPGPRRRCVAERERGVARRLRGLAVEGRRPPRAEQAGARRRRSRSAIVTSGNFSPMLGHGIALAFLPPDVEEGTAGRHRRRAARRVPARVVPTPFVGRAVGSSADADHGRQRCDRITMLALVGAAGARRSAACGGDDDSGGDDDDDHRPTTAATTAADDDGGDDGGTDAAWLGSIDEDCEFLLAGVVPEPAGGARARQRRRRRRSTPTQLEAIADEAPDEIQDAMATHRGGLRRDGRGLQGHRPLGSRSRSADPEVQRRSQDLRGGRSTRTTRRPAETVSDLHQRELHRRPSTDGSSAS